MDHRQDGFIVIPVGRKCCRCISTTQQNLHSPLLNAQGHILAPGADDGEISDLLHKGKYFLSYAACKAIGSTLRLHRSTNFFTSSVGSLLWSPWICAIFPSRTSTVTYGFRFFHAADKYDQASSLCHTVNIAANAVVQRPSLGNKLVGSLRADDLQFLI